MNDLGELLRELTADGGDARGDAVVFERAAAVAHGRRRRHRAVQIGATATALTLVVATVVALTTSDDTRREVQVVTTAPSNPPASAVSVADLLAGHWELIPPAPIPPGGVSVWTGHDLFVWGGASGNDRDVLSRDAGLFDPATWSWRKVSPSPLSARSNAAIAWTGTEVLVWGGYTDGRTGAVTNDGAAYNPTTGHWRWLPASPLPAEANTTAVWTGTRALFFSSKKTRIAAYDPSNNRWNTLTAPLPKDHQDGQWFEAVARGNGRDVLAWYHWFQVPPGESVSGTFGEGNTLFAYDATRNTWRSIGDAANRISNPQAAYWTDRGVLVRGNERICWRCDGPGPLPETSAWFNPDTNTWTTLPSDPLAPSPIGGADDLSSAWTGNALWSFNGGTQAGGPHFVLEPGDASVYDAAAGKWARLPRGLAGCDASPQSPVWTGHAVLAACAVYPRDAKHPSGDGGIAWVVDSPFHGVEACGGPVPPNASRARVAATITSPSHPKITVRNDSKTEVTIEGGSQGLWLLDERGHIVNRGVALASLKIGKLAPGHTTTLTALAPDVTSCVSVENGRASPLPAGRYRAVATLGIGNAAYSTDPIPVEVVRGTVREAGRR